MFGKGDGREVLSVEEVVLIILLFMGLFLMMVCLFRGINEGLFLVVVFLIIMGLDGRLERLSVFEGSILGVGMDYVVVEK